MWFKKKKSPEKNDDVSLVDQAELYGSNQNDASALERSNSEIIEDSTKVENVNKHTSFIDKPKNEKGIWFGLKKTRNAFTSLFSSSKVDSAWFDDLEDQLIMADVGIEATLDIIKELRHRTVLEKSKTVDDVLNELKEILRFKLLKVQESEINFEHDVFVLLMVGINGVGKTTTTAKLANKFQSENKQLMLAACDTYRAAAIEQLQTWGQRLNIPVVAHEHGSDAAAVAHDAYQKALAKNADVLIIDTAGRQHTHKNLMDQLSKIQRVLKKQSEALPHETWIVLDAGNGQNVLSQIETFSKYTPITGVCLTKLDGTAKGGIVFAIAEKFDLPVRFVGVGESMDDLLDFNVDDFIDALIQAPQ